MRIRTVKPEFWTHPVTGRWRGELQAFALSLLNAADDEGFFYADPASVRSAVRPFDEDSSNVRGMLAELSSAGWVEVVRHPQRGAVGRVTNFEKHQRIDRPKPSEISAHFGAESKSEQLALVESTKPRRSLDDESLLEGNREQGTGKGTGNREGKGTGRRRAAEDSPAVVALREAWNELTTAPIPKWTAGRAHLAIAALERRPLEQWREVFARINASPFCRGADGGWRADIDWALRPEGKKPETALKVLEGAFDRGAPARDLRKPMPPAVHTENRVLEEF